MNGTRILVVEDDPQIARFVAQALQEADYAVSVAGSIQQVEAELVAHVPELMVLDLGLPDGDGMHLLKTLRGWTSLPVLILSARSLETDKVDALDAGADDYLTKPFSVAELLARVRAMIRRAQQRHESEQAVKRFGEVEVDLVHRRVQRAGEALHLSPIEYRLLLALLTQPGRVLTHRQLLREVWGPGHADQSHYLRVYVGHLRHKLEIDPAQPRHLLTELGVGYRFVLEGQA